MDESRAGNRSSAPLSSPTNIRTPRRDTSTTTLVISEEFKNGTESAPVPVAVASSIRPPHQQRNLEAMATSVFGRGCPHCQSTTTIRTAAMFDREVWECRVCLRLFEMALPIPANVQCPHCGYGCGLYLAPKDERTAATPVRCFSCGADSAIERWHIRTRE